MVFVAPTSPVLRTGKVMIIFPGGGYQKVMVTKEGTKVAEHFASLGYSSFVVNVSLALPPDPACSSPYPPPSQYRLGRLAFMSVRSANVGPIVNDAAAALAFVRSQCGQTADSRFGCLDENKITVCGFSAGGHLALCLCARDGGELRDLPPKPDWSVREGEGGGGKPPPIRAALLIYPTLRSPTCWCVAGGLWMVPAMFGERGFKNSGEHCTCFGASNEAMGTLLPTLPKYVMCATVAGDMLLPAHKHSALLAKALEEHRGEKVGGDVRYYHGGPFWLWHGVGMHTSWADEADDWVRDNVHKEEHDKTKI